ncbi:hypothetical protein F383_15417 [Gossypium arboreum]|uniref:Uncharacterized protein n=1 Tax=Gossypium arboreum TaxID=29729 RepID=A0A0B0NAL7_GOSAR|nr:hypothetical protein F383_15417 [Gossypium arboreum]
MLDLRREMDVRGSSH